MQAHKTAMCEMLGSEEYAEVYSRRADWSPPHSRAYSENPAALCAVPALHIAGPKPTNEETGDAAPHLIASEPQDSSSDDESGSNSSVIVHTHMEDEPFPEPGARAVENADAAPTYSSTKVTFAVMALLLALLLMYC